MNNCDCHSSMQIIHISSLALFKLQQLAITSIFTSLIRNMHLFYIKLIFISLTVKEGMAAQWYSIGLPGCCTCFLAVL